MTEPMFGVVFDRPEPGRVYAWGPFSGFDAAARFAGFASAEIDPARVFPWQDAEALPGVRVLDPVAELLSWRESAGLPEAGASCPADCPCRQIPLTARWDNAVQHPNPDDTEDTETVICCIAEGGQPIALMLDDEHREALGLALLLPDGDGEVDPQHLELARENEQLRAQLADVERERSEVAQLSHQYRNQVERLTAELTAAKGQVRAASTVKCWTNEDGRRFVFAEDLAFALGYMPTAAAPAGSGASQ